MTNWTQWYAGITDDDVKFVLELVDFLQEKLDKCEESDDLKKKILNVQKL